MKCPVLMALILASFGSARADGTPLPTNFDFTITSDPTGCKYYFPSEPCNVAVSGSGSFTTTEPIGGSIVCALRVQFLRRGV